MASSANDRWVDDIDPSSDSLLPTLLPGQDNSAPSSPMSGASGFVASCGYRLSEVGLSEFRKAQVAGSIPVVGSSLFKCFELKPLLSHLTCQCLVADSCGLTLHFRKTHRVCLRLDPESRWKCRSE